MILLISHWVCSLAMTLIIWFVQLVHYPAFKWGDKETFPQFMLDHQRRISVIVLPFMLGELLTMLVLMKQNQSSWVWAAAALLAVIWVSTFALQVPCHRSLTEGYNVEIINRLVLSNWIRTGAWSVKLAVVTVGLWWG